MRGRALALVSVALWLTAGCGRLWPAGTPVLAGDPWIEVHAQYEVEDFGQGGGGPYTVRLQTVHFPPGAQTTIHRHYGPEMHAFQEGEMTIIAEHGTLRFRPGDSYLVPPGVIHRMRNDGTTAGRVLNVSVVPVGRPTSEEVPRALPE